MGNMRFKVGDKVRIKSIDWYNENKNHCGEIPLFKPSGLFVPDMSRYCNNIMTIKDICYGTCYRMKEDFWNYNWTDEMIEGLVEEETKPKFKVGDKVKWHNHICNITSIDTYENTYIYLIKYDDYREDATFVKWAPESELTFEDDVETKPKYEDEVTGEYYSTPKYLVRPNGYQFVDENGNVIDAMKIVLEKKNVLEKKSPKTDDIIKWLREHDMTKYIGVLYTGMCSITFDTEKLIKDITEMIGDE